MSEQKRLTPEQEADWQGLVGRAREEIASPKHHGPDCVYCRDAYTVLAVAGETERLRADLASITVHEGPACHTTHHAGCACHEQYHRRGLAVVEVKCRQAEVDLRVEQTRHTGTQRGLSEALANLRAVSDALGAAPEEALADAARRVMAELENERADVRRVDLALSRLEGAQGRAEQATGLLADETGRRLAAERERDELCRVVDSECPIGAFDLATTWRTEKQAMMEELEAERSRVVQLREALIEESRADCANHGIDPNAPCVWRPDKPAWWGWLTELGRTALAETAEPGATQPSEGEE